MDPEQFKEAVEEFKQIYQEECGIELSSQEAAHKASGLLQLFDSLTNNNRKELK